MNDFDVTIVGAGLAGLQFARLVASQGCRVLLIDRKQSLDERIHTTGIFVRKTLEDFDIPQHCLGPVIRHVSLFSPAHKELEFVSDEDEFRVARMQTLYLHYLNDCLRVGVQFFPETSYLDHEVSNGLLSINLRRGPDRCVVRSRLLVGCDGARSRVAEKLGLDLNREWIVGVEDVFTGARMEGPPRLCCFLDPTLAPGYIGWIAHDGFETHVGVGGYSQKFDPISALDRFKAKLVNILDLDRAKRTERRGGRIPVGGVLKNISNEYGILIGDAAGAVSPLTAGGLDPCMRLSSTAASVVISYLRSNDTQILKSYSGDLFRAKFTSRLWARRIASHLSSKLIAEMTCTALRLPIFKEIARHIFFGRTSFPDVKPGIALINPKTDGKLTAC